MGVCRRPRYKDAWHTGRPGARWAFLEKFVISRVPGGPYLTRWRLVATPWFSVFLHRIDGPDPDQDVHDHPWNFVSFVIRGGYVEQYVLPLLGSGAAPRTKVWRRWSVHRMPLGAYHKIERLLGVPTWTLILTGRRRREWGFLTHAQGHVPWRKYLGLED